MQSEILRVLNKEPSIPLIKNNQQIGYHRVVGDSKTYVE